MFHYGELFHYRMLGAGGCGRPIWGLFWDRSIRIVPLRVTGLRLGPSRRRWRAVRRPPGAGQCALDTRHPVAEDMHLSAQLAEVAAQGDLPAQALALCADGATQRLSLRIKGALERLSLRSESVPELLSLCIDLAAGWRLASESPGPVRPASRAGPGASGGQQRGRPALIAGFRAPTHSWGRW